MRRLRLLYWLYLFVSLGSHLLVLTAVLLGAIRADGPILYVIQGETALAVCLCSILLLHAASLVREYSRPASPVMQDFSAGLILAVCEIGLLGALTAHPSLQVLLVMLFFAFLAIHQSLLGCGILSPAFVTGAALLLRPGSPMTVIMVITGAASVALSHSFGVLVREMKDEAERADRAQHAATEFVRANTRLQHDASISEVRGTQSERLRLAREIHDLIGHSLTTMLMRIRMVRSTLVHGNAHAAAEELDDLELATANAIQEVRREVSLLRHRDPIKLSWVVRWRSLCRSFSESTGTSVAANIPDLELPIADDLGETVFRILQETLTNAVRHGRASVIDVTMMVKQDRGRLFVRISDNGRGAKTVVPGSGILGMQERVKALRGEFVWDTLPAKGFDVGIDLPLRMANDQSAAG